MAVGTIQTGKAKAPQPSALPPEQKVELQLRVGVQQQQCMDVPCSTVSRPRSLNECMRLFCRRRCVICEGEAHVKGAIQCPHLTLEQHPKVLE
jgi:hypothetical protein